MSDTALHFQNVKQQSLTDADGQKAIEKVLNENRKAAQLSFLQFENMELARRRAAYLRWKSMENLDSYLIDFEAAFTKRGGKVLWAKDAAEACTLIDTVLKKKRITEVVKSKSMVTEEIGLKKHLEETKILCHESDLGDFIQQQFREDPYHVVMPAIHRSFGNIRKMFASNLGMDPDSDMQQTVSFFRNFMRQRFASAGAGITGANFLMADTGSIAITENEGNAVLTATQNLHIVVAGIEKIIPSIKDVHLFWPLLSASGTGQETTAYQHIISGPGTEGHNREMYVILLDNGRSDVLASPDQREALWCIKCGACMNVCPVYRLLGGPAYGQGDMGPIGSVLLPHKKGLNEYRHLPHASTLCGKCTDVCPVKIDVSGLLQKMRRDIIMEGHGSAREKIIFYFWKKHMLHRDKFNRSVAAKNFFLQKIFRRSWGTQRVFPKLAPKSFNEMWREKFPNLNR
jgi:L-lactate dehydrogenase complex protein LldF